jgi:hypothetical protein
VNALTIMVCNRFRAARRATSRSERTDADTSSKTAGQQQPVVSR